MLLLRSEIRATITNLLSLDALESNFKIPSPLNYLPLYGFHNEKSLLWIQLSISGHCSQHETLNAI